MIAVANDKSEVCVLPVLQEIIILPHLGIDRQTYPIPNLHL